MTSLKAVDEPMLMSANKQAMTVVTPIDHMGTEARESTLVAVSVHRFVMKRGSWTISGAYLLQGSPTGQAAITSERPEHAGSGGQDADSRT